MAEQDHSGDYSLVYVTVGTIIFMIVVGYIITTALNA